MANCYILGCENSREAAVIDPGGDEDQILMELAESKFTVKYLLNTHGHFDHVGANLQLKKVTGADILIHELDAPMLGELSAAAGAFGLTSENSPPPDRTVEEGDIISFGDITLTVIHTPGHTPGGICFVGAGEVFVGDTLFSGSIGRTDFPGGDYDTLITSIREKLFVMDDHVKVFPGHMGTTTIGQEKKFNPFVKMD
jgi:hydroxyacylglutathione hydrolase